MAPTTSNERYEGKVADVMAFAVKAYAIQQWKSVKAMLDGLHVTQRVKIKSVMTQIVSQDIDTAFVDFCGVSPCTTDESMIIDAPKWEGEPDDCGWYAGELEQFQKTMTVTKHRAYELDAMIEQARRDNSKNRFLTSLKKRQDVKTGVSGGGMLNLNLTTREPWPELAVAAERLNKQAAERRAKAAMDEKNAAAAERPELQASEQTSSNVQNVIEISDSSSQPDDTAANEVRLQLSAESADASQVYRPIPGMKPNAKPKLEKPKENRAAETTPAREVAIKGEVPRSKGKTPGKRSDSANAVEIGLHKPIPGIQLRFAFLGREGIAKPSVTEDYKKNVVDQGFTFLPTFQPQVKNLGAIVALAKSLRYQLLPRVKKIAPKSHFPHRGKPSESESKVLIGAVTKLATARYRSVQKFLQNELKNKGVQAGHFLNFDWLAPIQLKALLNHICSHYELPNLRLAVALQEFSVDDRFEEDNKNSTKECLESLAFEKLGQHSVHPRLVKETRAGWGPKAIESELEDREIEVSIVDFLELVFGNTEEQKSCEHGDQSPQQSKQ